MNSGVLGYKLSPFTGLVQHAKPRSPLLHDEDRISLWLTGRERVNVQVRSGDYFVTLATILDRLSNSLDDYAVRSELEDIVSDLIYLQDTYDITEK
jgi:hypothetical protein